MKNSRLTIMDCLSSISDVYGVERIFFFDDLERFDESFGLKMLEKFDDDVSCVHFRFTAGVGDSAFFKHVGEGDDLAHVLVKFNFCDTANDVVFEHDVHEAVANVRRVKKSRRVRQDLFPLFGNFHERRNAVEEDDRRVISVDESFVEVRGQN